MHIEASEHALTFAMLMPDVMCQYGIPKGT